MAAAVATVALALAPMLDLIAELEHKAHHHHQAQQHHRRGTAPPPAMQTATASWYSYPPGTSTACGFSSPMGVASRTLPCGTKVRFCAVRCVVAVVDDRGPYVYSRLWDLSVTLAQAIGFDLGAGVMPIRWAIV
jgi:rare lipoprotein A (peptidoglycan hydrolase)